MGTGRARTCDERRQRPCQERLPMGADDCTRWGIDADVIGFGWGY